MMSVRDLGFQMQAFVKLPDRKKEWVLIYIKMQDTRVPFFRVEAMGCEIARVPRAPMSLLEGLLNGAGV
jgi:hypothetical protein